MGSNIISALANDYYAAGSISRSKTKYVNVDPTRFEGTWKGKYGDGKSFEIAVSQVQGFKAMVKYQSGGVSKYTQVLIKDDGFRIGDTKMVIIGKKAESAAVATAVTDPYTGGVAVKKGTASRS